MKMLPFLRSAQGQFDARVNTVRSDQWNLSTPNDEWTVRDLVNHVVTEQLWVPPILAGRSIAEVGNQLDGDNLGEDPVRGWQCASVAARRAFEEPGAVNREVQLSSGAVSATDYGWQLTTDLTVHAWDLARATGGLENFPNDLLAAVLDHVKNDAESYADSQLFASPIPVPGCTDDLTELLARLGRHRWWTRS